ncbi:hypothetical protein LMG3415_00496 [Achromobacter mucicolens]|uniref:Secreted protein n=1 Tax=Achromobacter mucicolens TaxID=1389922 RepID=A0ABM8L7D3_9BURK|nr:hypothetical protein LMG3415_00496 [Achromobacter mucicolens]
MALATGIFFTGCLLRCSFAARRDAHLAGVLFSDGAWMLSGRGLCFLVTPRCFPVGCFAFWRRLDAFRSGALLSSDARRVAGLWRAGLRLRSGAFAPDFPFVIFVQAFGLPFRFPRAHLHAPRTTGRRHAGLGWIQLGGRWGGLGSLGSCRRCSGFGASFVARPTTAARAAWRGIRSVSRRGDDAARCCARCLTPSEDYCQVSDTLRDAAPSPGICDPRV